MADTEHVQYVVVAVPQFGDPTQTAEQAVLSVARAVHHWVRPGASVAPVELAGPPTGAFVRTAPWKTLDPKGDDMGHHPDHPEPLVPAAP